MMGGGRRRSPWAEVLAQASETNQSIDVDTMVVVEDPSSMLLWDLALLGGQLPNRGSGKTDSEERLSNGSAVSKKRKVI